MKETLYIVYKNIDTFIHIGRHTSDFGCFIFYRDPIYEIEASSQPKGVELSSLVDWSSCIYVSDDWNPNDDMVTYLFRTFVDGLL